VADQNLTTLSDYLGVLKRRSWIVLVTVVIAGASAYLYTKQQTPVFSASAKVVLASPLASGQHQSQAQQTAAAAQQAQFAHSASMAAKAYAAARAVSPVLVARMTPLSLLAGSTIVPDSTSSLLTITVDARTAAQAIGLATTYARVYATTQNAADVAVIKAHIATLVSQRDALSKQINQDHAAGLTPNQADVASYRQVIHLIAAAQTTLASAGGRTSEPAVSATQVKPAGSKDMAAGLGLGVVIGLSLIAFAEALDSRVRRSDAVGDQLGLPLLARIPTPPRSLRKTDSLGMLVDDASIHSEAYRQLRVNFDLANVGQRARTVMLTSAVEQEGKSTTVANLAIAFARAGRHVILVDLDLRRPEIDRLLNLGARPGFVDVVYGDTTLESALFRASLPGAGTLEVLTTGPTPPNPSDFLSDPRVATVLGQLAERADIVLMDTAPLLPVSDSVVLSTHVDAMLVAVRASTVNQSILGELHRTLERCPAAKLGFVLTAADRDPGGYYSAYYREERSRRAPEPTDARGASPHGMGVPDSDAAARATPR